MNPRLPILLRHKYGLVHVPSEKRCIRWRDTCRSEIDTGVPPEAAGLAAARGVFPYEAKGRVAPDGAPVSELLGMWE